MPKKQFKKDPGALSHKEWERHNRKLDSMGLHGTDYYVNKVEKLEAKVKRLEAKLKKKGNK